MRLVKTILKKNKMGWINLPTSRFTVAVVIKCGSSSKIENKTHGTEQKIRKQTPPHTTNWFLINMQKQFNGGRTNFSTNGVGWISRVKKKKKERNHSI